MRSLPAWFDGVDPQGLHRHLQHLAQILPGNSTIEVEIAEPRAVVPCLRQDYRTKGSTVSIRLRVTSFGRAPLMRLYERFRQAGYDLKARRSIKRRLMSQFSIVLPTDDTMFPATATSILRTICTEIGGTWPATFAVGYATDQVERSLPGSLTIDHPFWKAGYATGQLIGRAVRAVLPKT